MLLKCGAGEYSWESLGLESPTNENGSKEIKLVNLKGNQPWILIGRTDAEAEAQILWPPHAKSWLIGIDLDDGRDWGQEEKGMTEDKMAGWHHWLDGHEFGCTLGVGDGQGGLACCDSWGPKESDTIEHLNWTELNWTSSLTKTMKLLMSYPKYIPHSNIYGVGRFTWWD